MFFVLQLVSEVLRKRQYWRHCQRCHGRTKVCNKQTSLKY